MAINWFPGHIRKTQREIKENLKNTMYISQYI